MSAKFEKIVLEKFDELNSKINGLSEEMHEIKEKVEQVEEKVDNNTNSINNLSLKVEQVDEKVENNTNSINNLSLKVEQVKEKVDNNSNLINNLSKKIDINTELIAGVSKQVEQQGLNFARFENEFTIKVQSLFDSFVANTESHLSYEKSIAVLHAKTFDHNNRISVLEDYYKGTKLLANS